MAKYLLTGAAGFIGRRVSEMLCEQGHQVIGVDNLNDSYDVRMKIWRLDQLRRVSGFHFIQRDICDVQTFYDISDAHPDIEAVIHLAARAGVRQAGEIPEVYLQNNANGTLNVLEWCRKYGNKKIILASTSSIYGANPPLPTTEDADSSRPLQIYAASKKAAEVMTYVYHHLYGLDATIFRFFTVYGPAGRPDMVMFRFTQWVAEGRKVAITGDGSQMRGFTYVDDIARGVIAGLRPLGYEIINLGGHEPINMNDLLSMIEVRLGKKANVEYIERHPADVNANLANVDKARHMLGWEPQVSLEQGVSALVDWYVKERTWASDILTP